MEAIRDAPTAEPETDCLEWKSEWDLNETEKCFETAKHILGFGNRSVSAARGYFGGCSYLVLGVEPGNLCGLSPLDPATLNGKLGRYVESGKPRWSPQYIEVDGLSVLVITIEAPRDGDSICTLQKAFGGFGEGRIFNRRHGQTEEAKPAEIRDLERRIRSGRPQVELDLRRVGESSLPIVSIPPALEEAWTEGERKRLALPPDPARQARDPFHFPPPVTMNFSLDTRSRDSYRKEVSAYMKRAGRHLRAEVIERLIKADISGLKLEIGNPTDKNFDGVEVVLKIPAGPTVWHETHEVATVLGASQPPKPWGKQRPFEVVPPNIQSLTFRSSVEIVRDEGGATVRFAPEHVRPFASVSLPTVHLVLLEDDPGEIEVSWTLTSSGVDGQAAGTVVCQVDDNRLIPNLKQQD